VRKHIETLADHKGNARNTSEQMRALKPRHKKKTELIKLCNNLSEEMISIRQTSAQCAKRKEEGNSDKDEMVFANLNATET